MRLKICLSFCARFHSLPLFGYQFHDVRLMISMKPLVPPLSATLAHQFTRNSVFPFFYSSSWLMIVKCLRAASLAIIWVNLDPSRTLKFLSFRFSNFHSNVKHFNVWQKFHWVFLTSLHVPKGWPCFGLSWIFFHIILGLTHFISVKCWFRLLQNRGNYVLGL